MANVLETIIEGLEQALLMAYQVWWALVLGFAISAAVQAWVPRERIEATMSGDGARPVAWATGLGAASSSCSYAAIAIAKSLFQKGASAASGAVVDTTVVAGRVLMRGGEPADEEEIVARAAERARRLGL